MADKQSFFQRQKKTKQNGAPKPEVARDYSVLPEMAALLTNGNEQAVADMRLLAKGVGGFVQAHSEWCTAKKNDDFGASDDMRQVETLIVFAYWLTGYAATGDVALYPRRFGAYIDWKEETYDIIRLLGDADGNLGYGLNLNEIKLDDTGFTDEALQMIGEHLSAKALALCALDTQSDSYHLFVLRDEDYGTLQSLSERVGFRFYREFK